MCDPQTIKYYATNALELYERYHRADVSVLHARLLETFPRRSKLLELGCGAGRETAFLQGKEYEVYGLDASEAMLAAARSWHPELTERLHCVSLPNRLPYPDSSFDGVLALAVMMHLPDTAIRKTLREVKRILKSSGLLFLSVPIERNDIGANSRDVDGRLFTMFSAKSWETLVMNAGFEISKTFIDPDSLNRNGFRWLSLVGNRADAGT